MTVYLLLWCYVWGAAFVYQFGQMNSSNQRKRALWAALLWPIAIPAVLAIDAMRRERTRQEAIHGDLD